MTPSDMSPDLQSATTLSFSFSGMYPIRVGYKDIVFGNQSKDRAGKMAQMEGVFCANLMS